MVVRQKIDQALLVETIEASPDFIVITDISGNGLYYNTAARQILGIKKEESFLLASAYSPLTHELIFNEGIPTAIEKGVWKGETSILKHDGTEMPVSQIIIAHKADNGEVQFLSIMAHDITERKQLESMFSRQALYDALTGLPNRRHLYQKLAQIIGDASQEDRFAILFMDLDGFKVINDSLGHQAGDKVLQTTAARLKRYIREIDFVSRYAGDEFVIVLKHVKELDEIRLIANRIIKILSQPFQLEEKEVQISGSIGVSLYPYHGTDEVQLIKIADEAMYEVKKRGKGTYQIYNSVKFSRGK
ncbi:MAG TPA: diguanylate cyclase [Bacillus bacterium]|nr:diguanylate cyclase [Bacillus sp. (in: firmicutes)]